jgi:uncharacterized metal-binding protein YceD (DUF177 family)
MSHVRLEFSRPVSLARLGSEPYRQRIEATAEERRNLAERFELSALDRLAAEVELRRKGGGGLILLEAEFEAEFEQSCAVTLEPVRGALSDRFSLVYGPARDDAPEIEVSGDEPAFEPLTGEMIDIGEAVAQGLSLALPEFPRHPDASIDEFLAADATDSPFASLARLRKRLEC